MTNQPELPGDLRPYVVDRPARRSDTYAWLAGPGLDPTHPVVQKLAYELLTAGWTWHEAMYGGFTRPATFVGFDDEGRRISGGNDGRWFASTPDVVEAADGWRLANDLPNWRKTENDRSEPPSLAL